MAARRRRGKKKKPLKRWLSLGLLALLVAFSGLITAGEHYGWPLPRWSEIETALGINDAPTVATDSPTTIYFIDVGQANATLIRQGEEYALIDAGEIGEGDRLVEYLKAAGVTRLRCVVMTHPHSDHIGGMPEVLAAFPVDEFLLPDFSLLDQTPSSDILAKTLTALETQKQNGCKVETAARGMKIPIGEGELRVLLAGIETDNANNLSVCTKFVAGSFSCLFTGDGEKKVEEELLAVEPDLRADVFLAAHHGSRTSNSEEFLAAVRPRTVVISCGMDNSYGHPHAEVVDRFEALGAAVYRTDQQGSIQLTVDTDGAVTVTCAREGEVS